MKNRFVAVSLLLVLLLMHAVSPASAMMTTDEKTRLYQNAILELETYLESPNSKGESLYGIQATFQSLGRFEQSRNMNYYTMVHIKLYEETYDFEMKSDLELMELDQYFQEYLNNELKGSPLRTVADLKSYVEARENEHNRDYESAMACYKICMGYYDAAERFNALRETGYQQKYDQALMLQNARDFAGAYFLFSEVEPYEDSTNRKRAIEKLLGYTPISADDNPLPVTELQIETTSDTQIVLQWSAAAHAKTYEVQYRKNGGNWLTAGETITTGFTASGLQANTAYDFRVTAIAGEIRMDAASITAKTAAIATPNPTKTPTPVPTAAPQTTNAPAASKSKNTRIAAGNYHTVALKADGTVLADGNNYWGQCNVGEWKNIVSIAAGEYHTVGLRSDGTVVAVGRNDYGQCSWVDGWEDVIQIAAGSWQSYGLKADGTVLCTADWDGFNIIREWTDIVSIAAGYNHVVGLKSDGTVVACSNQINAEFTKVEAWQGMTEVYAGDEFTAGRKSADSHWQIIGENKELCKKISAWNDVQSIAVLWYFDAIGLTDSGHIITTSMSRANASLEDELAKWNNIIEIAAGLGHCVGLQADGTVIAAINHGFSSSEGSGGYEILYEYGESKINDWNIFE